MVAASQTLRSEQEDFAAETETRTAQLTEFVSYTRVSATELSDVAAMGADVLRGLIAAASEQFKAIAITLVLSLVATAIIAYAVKAVIGLRPTEEDEARGLDISDHGEEGYNHNS